MKKKYDLRKIILATPPAVIEERYGKVSRVGNTMASLGLAYLAAFIRNSGFNPYIIESEVLNYSIKDIINIIESEKPGYVGISSVTGTIFKAAELAKSIKKVHPRLTVIIGGAHVSAVPRETLERFPSFDIGVVGEGELTLLNILKTLQSNDNLSKVNGIVYRDGDNIRLNKAVDFIKDLDDLPLPAWDLIPGFPKLYNLAAPISVKKPEASIITSRGCPYNCLFCDRSVFGEKYRFHSSDYVFEMFEVLKSSYNVRNIMIYDDSFMAHKKRLHDVCEKLIKKKNKVTWSCIGNVHVDFESLKLMKAAGCWQIGFGIESGSERILKIIRKSQKIEQVRTTINLTRKAGIRIRGFFIVGSPEETVEDIQKTIDFAKELPLDDFQMTNFTPFPGSEAYRIAHKYGSFDNSWENMNALKPTFVPYSLSESELTYYQNKGHRDFYLRFRIVFRYLLFAIKYPRMLLNMFNGLLVLLNMVWNNIFDRERK